MNYHKCRVSLMNVNDYENPDFVWVVFCQELNCEFHDTYPENYWRAAVNRAMAHYKYA